ncbi:MAG TPA: diacylglycerol kinase family protein [Polyangia bacterium]|nr:diacylglycerol kinase family protein [Polyangia bacterium]
MTNPRSRLNRRDPGSMRRLAYLIGSRGAVEATASLDDLYRVAEEFRRAEIDILGINGGDGTLHHTLTAFLRTYGEQPLPPIALLRGGTMNTVANSLGIRGRPARLLFELVDRYHNGADFEYLENPILAIGDAYGFIFGNGLIYNFLDAYYKTGKPSPSMAARLVTRTVASAMVGGALAKRLTRRFLARVTVDGDRWAREDFLTVAASSVEQIGLGFKPFYRVHEGRKHEGGERFPVVGIHAPSAIDLVAELPRIFRGQPIRRDKVIDVLAREAIFEADEIDYIIDGDPYQARGSLRVGIGPRLRIVRLSGRVADERPLPSLPAMGSG